MNKPPMDCRIKRPFKYVPASATDVRKTIREARKALEDVKPKPKATNVQQLKKLKQAA